MIIQACECIDNLNCEIYDYMGQRITTKKELYNNRYSILKIMREQKPEIYNQCKFAIVN
jgi:hypothetical protein